MWAAIKRFWTAQKVQRSYLAGQRNAQALYDLATSGWPVSHDAALRVLYTSHAAQPTADQFQRAFRSGFGERAKLLALRET